MKSIKAAIILFLIVFLSSPALAYDKVFDKYIYQLDTFQVKDDIFYINGLTNNDLTVILTRNNDELFFIRNGTCEKTVDYDYCFMGTKLDYSTYGRPKPNSLEWEPAINIQVYSKKPDISISREITTKINRDESTIITVTIKNEGVVDIEDLSYEDIMPDNIKMTSTGYKVVFIRDTMKWTKPLLQAGDTETLSYTIQPESYDSILLNNGTLTYRYGNSTFKDYAPKQRIEINFPFKIESKLDKTKANLGDAFSYSFKLTNQDWEDSLVVEFALGIPPEIDIVNLPNDFIRSKSIKYDFTLRPSEDKSFSIDMKGRREGFFRLSPIYTINIRDDKFKYQNNLTMNVSIPRLEPELSLSTSEALSDSDFRVTAYMNNPTTLDYYDLTGTLQIGSQVRALNFSRLRPGVKQQIFDEKMVAPDVENITAINILLDGKYKSPGFDYISFHANKTLKVKPFNMNFEIEKTLSKKEMFPGDDVTVTLKVKNTGTTMSTVNLEENIATPLEVVAGLTSKKLSLTAGKKEEFYIYKFRIPQNITPGDYSLKTNLKYNDEIVQVKEVNITIKAKNESINKTAIPDKEKDSSAKPSSEKKKSIVAVIIDFFVNIFR